MWFMIVSNGSFQMGRGWYGLGLGTVAMINDYLCWMSFPLPDLMATERGEGFFCFGRNLVWLVLSRFSCPMVLELRWIHNTHLCRFQTVIKILPFANYCPVLYNPVLLTLTSQIYLLAHPANPNYRSFPSGICSAFILFGHWVRENLLMKLNEPPS